MPSKYGKSLSLREGQQYQRPFLNFEGDRILRNKTWQDFSEMVVVFNKTIIPRARVGYEMIQTSNFTCAESYIHTYMTTPSSGLFRASDTNRTTQLLTRNPNWPEANQLATIQVQPRS